MIVAVGGTLQRTAKSQNKKEGNRISDHPAKGVLELSRKIHQVSLDKLPMLWGIRVLGPQRPPVVCKIRVVGFQRFRV